MPMSPALLAALKSRNPTLVYLVVIEFSDRTVRLCDGAGYVVWGGNIFQGSDPEIGTIAGFGDFIEQEGTESPRQSIQFLVNDNASIVKLSSPESQGTPVSIYAAAIDPATGLLIGEPDARFIGEIDDAEISFAKNERLLTIELSTVWELLFDDTEGSRWNDTYWTYLYGENARAFIGVNNVGRKLFWGYRGPQSGSGGSTNPGGFVNEPFDKYQK